MQRPGAASKCGALFFLLAGYHIFLTFPSLNFSYWVHRWVKIGDTGSLDHKIPAI